MSISNKFYLGFGTIILFLLISSSLAYYQLHKLNEQYTFLIEDRVYKTIKINQILNASSSQGNYIRSYILEPHNPTTLEKLESHKKFINKEIKALDNSFNSQSMKNQLQILKESQAIFDEASQEIIDTYNGENLQAILDVLSKKARPANSKIQSSTKEIVAYQTKQMQEVQAKSSKAAQVSSTLIIIISVISIISAIFIAIFLTRIIVIPVNKLANSAKVIAEGDLSQEDVAVKSNDEIKNLAESFNIMKSSLRKLLLNVTTNVELTTSSAEQLAASTDEVSHSSKDVATRVEKMALNATQASSTAQESTNTIEESANAVQNIAEATQTLYSKAINTQSIANKGGETLQSINNQMLVIQETSNDTNNRIKKLSLQTTEIENISNVITSISEQTNLLALNAAIEAARAGNHGKGFAVVAEEVRKLAEESKISANQIVELTTNIQQDTKEVEKSVTHAVQNVNEGVSFILNAQVAFDDIINAIEEMTSQIENVSASTQQISASSEEIAASINELASASVHVSEQSELISAAVEEETATIQEINSVAKSLNEGAMVLQEEIKKFKI
ncbi:hypothetical protein EP18_14795 [Lysinibacillus sphaericus]|nr:methyl-accepting chemotaxis protein [Lysinibacillus sphaericus]KEK10912.1 hypothetical protein EP18_14795 [Lysinibacillus sphaericus]